MLEVGGATKINSPDTQIRVHYIFTEHYADLM